MSWTKEWHNVVFSDEKKFNLDGPDGYNYYYHDLRKDEHFLSRRHTCEGGVMVRGSVSVYGTCDLEFVTSKMKAETYKSLLQKAFPHYTNIFHTIKWTYQHDNAPIHTARVVKEWIKAQNVNLLEWPPYSPDLNIMENVWGLLSRKVYEGGRQFDCKETLVAAIKLAWTTISLQILENLYSSLPNRVFEVISNKGGFTHY